MRMRAAPCRVAVLLVGCACFASSVFAQGGFSSFIERMDANGNGWVEPDESSRFGDLLRRVAEATRYFDARRPVPVSRLQRAFERYREIRSRDRGSDNRGSDNRDNRGPSNRGGFPGSGGSSDSDLEPLVPDFRPETEPLPPPGFGTMADMFVVQVTDEDRKDARDRFRRYDRNGDGLLSPDELRSGRWYDDPLRWDANHDGTLTVDEMAVRYARRRVDRAKERAEREKSQQQQQASRPGDPRSGDPRSGDPRRSDGDRSSFGRRGFGFGGRGPRFGFTEPPQDGASMPEQPAPAEGEYESESESSSEEPRPKSYRIPSPEERLPLGLPSWFAEQDKNGDGQVFMSEFAESWDLEAIRTFERLDANGDGVILPDEALEAVAAGEFAYGEAAPPATAGESPSEGSSSPAAPTDAAADAKAPAPAEGEPSGPSADSPPEGAPQEEAPAAATGGSDQVAGSAAEKPETPVKVDPRLVTYAAGLIKKYDKNEDGSLVEEEWQGLSKSPAKADTDGDGKVTAYEYAVFLSH